MVVSRMLIKRELQRVFDEALFIHQDIKDRSYLEAGDITLQLERKIKQLKSFELTLSFMEPIGSASDLTDIYNAFRQLKIELRLIRRKWKRMISMESRSKKVQERESHVASIAG